MGKSLYYCGDVRTKWEDCSAVEGDDLVPIKLGCTRMECPICHYRIAVREAYKAYDRLDGFRKQCSYHGLDVGEPVHMIISPPPEIYSHFGYREGYSKINDQAIRLLQDVGVIGGSFVWHQVRGKPWQIKKYKAGELQLKVSWHGHAVGYMPSSWLIKSNDFYESTGWIYKNIPIVTKGGARNVIAYELNHAAVYTTDTVRTRLIRRRHSAVDELLPEKARTSHALRWFGALSYNQLKCVETRTKSVKLCRRCDADKHRYFETRADDQGEAYQFKRTRQYTLSDSQFESVLRRLAVGGQREGHAAARTPAATVQEVIT